MSKQLLAITLIGVGLRFYRLGYMSLWLDEAWTWYFSSMSWLGIWETTAYEYNPPGFYWITKAVMFFGDSEFMLRLIPAVFGTIAIPVMYLIGKEFYKSEKAGIVAAIFMTFSPFGFWYSQEARTYTVTLVLVSLAVYFWLKNKHVLFGVFSALAFWTHFYAIIPFVLVLLMELRFLAFIWWDTHKNGFEYKPGTMSLVSKPMIKHFVAFGIIAFPVLVTTTRLFFVRTAKAPTYGMQGIDIITNILYVLAGNYPFAVILSGLLILGMVVLWFRDRLRFIMLSVFIAGPLLISFGFSYLFPMLPRYLIYLLPFWILGMTACYNALTNTLKSAVVLSLSMAILAFIPFATIYYTAPLKQDWRNSVKYIESQIQPGDSLVVMPREMDNPFNYYYRGDVRAIYTSDITLTPNADYYIVADDFAGVQSKSVTLDYLNNNYLRNDDYAGIHIFRR